MKIENPALLDLFRQAGRCELCKRPCAVREAHHVRAKGMAGGGQIDLRINLISLGSSTPLPSGKRRFFCACHKRAQEKKIPERHVLSVVALRERCTVEEIEEVMNLLRNLMKPTETQLRNALERLSAGGRILATRELVEAGKLPEFLW